MSLRLAFAGCLTVLACTSPTEVSRDAERLIQTDALGYSLAPNLDGGWHTSIPYVFTNSTGGTVYIKNCGGSFGLLLQREDAGEWHAVWGPGLPLCKSAPIVIENNALFHDTLYVDGAKPGSNTEPQWDRENPSGIYRIVWDDDVVSPYPEPAIALDARISNRFILRK